MRIIIDLPDRTPLAALHGLAQSVDGNLRQSGPFEYRICPRSNSNVVKFPKRQKQFMHADLPTGPEAA